MLQACERGGLFEPLARTRATGYALTRDSWPLKPRPSLRGSRGATGQSRKDVSTGDAPSFVPSTEGVQLGRWHLRRAACDAFAVPDTSDFVAARGYKRSRLSDLRADGGNDAVMLRLTARRIAPGVEKLLSALVAERICRLAHRP